MPFGFSHLHHSLQPPYPTPVFPIFQSTLPTYFFLPLQAISTLLIQPQNFINRAHFSLPKHTISSKRIPTFTQEFFQELPLSYNQSLQKNIHQSSTKILPHTSYPYTTIQHTINLRIIHKSYTIHSKEPPTKIIKNPYTSHTNKNPHSKIQNLVTLFVNVSFS